MAITARSLAQLRELRTDVGQLADDAVRTIAEAWLAAWERLSPAWQAALAAVVDTAARTGRWPSSWQLARIPEVAQAATATDQAGVALSAATGTAIVSAVGGIVAATLVAEPLILAAQLPAAVAATAAAGYAARVNGTVVDTSRRTLIRRVNDVTAALGADASSAVGRTLVRGLPAGTPLGTGGLLLDRLQAAFSQVASRAITAAQTESLDANRAAAGVVHDANADVITEWVWISALDSRSCLSCWSMHGTAFPIAEPGPLDHHQGRCARLARLRPWRSLGITGDEPDDVVTDAEQRFRKLPRVDQLKIVGAARLQMLDDNEIEWAQLAVRRSSRKWRDAFVPRPLADLRRLAGRRET